MRKVVVFDSGWGGEVVANYIEQELAVIDVIRVIDWRHAPYMIRSRMEVLSAVEAGIRPYLQRVDAVVLAGYEPSLVVDTLRKRHPEIEFVDFSLRKLKITGLPVKKVMILADSRLRRTVEYKDLRWRAWIWTTEIVEPDCDRWVKMIDDGEMNYDFLMEELNGFEAWEERIDVVLVANTHFWDITQDLRKILRWQVRVVDYRKEIVRDLCKALRLKGVDGRRQSRN